MIVSGAKAYFHEEMRRVDSFCFCMYGILVVKDEIVDVENEAYSLFLIRMSDRGVVD